MEIYKLSFELALKVHNETLELPSFELFEQGSQLRRSTKRIVDTIVEGYGRNRYKDEFIRFLIFALSSCDEAISQLSMLSKCYPKNSMWLILHEEYNDLGKKINSFIQYVEKEWRSKK